MCQQCQGESDLCVHHAMAGLTRASDARHDATRARTCTCVDVDRRRAPRFTASFGTCNLPVIKLRLDRS